MKRLFLDIETVPFIGWFWRTGKQYIDASQIIEESAICIIAWAWGNDKVQSLVWDKNQSDKEMLKQVSRLIIEADEVIAHKGETFDLPAIRTRCFYHKLDPLPIIKLADTLRWARKYYNFASNRLDYIDKYRGGSGKSKVGIETWLAIKLKNDRKALAKLERYCKRDVKVLRDNWKEFAISCPAQVHSGVLLGRERSSCPRCGSKKTIISKTRITATGSNRHQMQCQAKSCGGYFTVSDSVLK